MVATCPSKVIRQADGKKRCQLALSGATTMSLIAPRDTRHTIRKSTGRAVIQCC